MQLIAGISIGERHTSQVLLVAGVCAILAVGAWGSDLASASGPGSTISTAVTLPNSQFVDLRSSSTGRDYRVFIARPDGDPPLGGWPVVYVLDGNAYFSPIASAVRLWSMYGDVAPAIVVGVGYPSDDLEVALHRRNLDLTPTQPDPSELWRGEKLEDFGDCDEFLRFIEKEVKPLVEARLPVAPGSDVLYGHSLGGLATLHALFTRPASYAAYVAISPSIWWNARALLLHEPELRESIRQGKIAPRIFVAAGEYDDSLPPQSRLPAPERAKLLELMRTVRMVDNAEQLVARLRAVPAPLALQIAFRIDHGGTHMSTPWGTLHDALDFVLRRPPCGD